MRREGRFTTHILLTRVKRTRLRAALPGLRTQPFAQLFSMQQKDMRASAWRWSRPEVMGAARWAPFSDIDILFLVPEMTDQVSAAIEDMLYILWDIKLKVGHATRSISDALALAKSDMTILTSLLESRLIVGEQALFDHFYNVFSTKILSRNVYEFITAKLADRDARHAYKGGAHYMLEPNVKEGKGGLRDLQTLFWVMKGLASLGNPDKVARADFFTQTELEAFANAEDFLWTARCHLHLKAGRATEVLTFEHQPDIATALGYADGAGRSAAEHFMQDFFRQTITVGDLTRVVLSALEAEHLKPAPSVTHLSHLAAVPPEYRLTNGRLDIADEAKFLAYPVNLLRLFDIALRNDLPIHPNAMRIVAAHLDCIAGEVREDKKAQAIFLDLLLTRGNPERALRRMNELGVLGRFMPEFGRIVAMMQSNYYHHYTVDEHTIQCIAHLARAEAGNAPDLPPLVTDILGGGVDRRILYVALLLHDIGKGLPEAHEIAGARIAETIAPRLSFDERETTQIVWLVRHHLVMSDVAQKRDINDPRTIADFAGLVSDVERLDLLCVLTFCDIHGVGPGTLTAWKTALLVELYRATRAALENRGADATAARVAAAQQALAARLHDRPATDVSRELKRHGKAYWLGLDTDTHATLAGLLDQVNSDNPIVIEVRDLSGCGTSRICIAAQDYQGLFSKVAGALTLTRMNVIGARVYTALDGLVTAMFEVQDSTGNLIGTGRKHQRLVTTIKKAAFGEVTAHALADQGRNRPNAPHIEMPTRIHIDNSGSEFHTIVEIDTKSRRRPAL